MNKTTLAQAFNVVRISTITAFNHDRPHPGLNECFTLTLSLSGDKCNRGFNRVEFGNGNICQLLNDRCKLIYAHFDGILEDGLLKIINTHILEYGYKTEDGVVQIITGIKLQFIPGSEILTTKVTAYTIYDEFHFDFYHQFMQSEGSYEFIGCKLSSVIYPINLAVKEVMGRWVRHDEISEPDNRTLVQSMHADVSNRIVNRKPLTGVELKTNPPDKINQWVETYNGGLLAKLCLVMLSDTWAPKTVSTFAKCFSMLYDDIVTNKLNVIELVEDLLPMLQHQYHEQTVTFFNELQEKINEQTG